jgi:hypothetical protein
MVLPATKYGQGAPVIIYWSLVRKFLKILEQLNSNLKLIELLLTASEVWDI